MEKIGCLEPWWKCGKTDSEWFNFFSNIQSSGFNDNFTEEQFEEFFLNKENNKQSWI